MKNAGLLLLSFVTLCTAVAADGTEKQLIELLQASDAQSHVSSLELARAAGKVSNATERRIFDLAGMSSDPSSNIVERDSSRWVAILLLGELRVESAIPWLIENIQLHSRDYEAAGNSQEKLSFDHYFPCAAALIAFGGKAAPASVATVRGQKDEINRGLLLATLARVIKNRPEATDITPTKLPADIEQEVKKLRIMELPRTRNKKDEEPFSPTTR